MKGSDWIKRRYQDLIILATAKANDACLITKNPKDFEEMMKVVSSAIPLCSVGVSGSRVRVSWLNTDPVKCVESLTGA